MAKVESVLGIGNQARKEGGRRDFFLFSADRPRYKKKTKHTTPLFPYVFREMFAFFPPFPYLANQFPSLPILQSLFTQDLPRGHCYFFYLNWGSRFFGAIQRGTRNSQKKLSRKVESHITFSRENLCTKKTGPPPPSYFCDWT